MVQQVSSGFRSEAEGHLMMLGPGLREAGSRCCNDPRSTRDCSRRGASRVLADSLFRSARSHMTQNDFGRGHLPLTNMNFTWRPPAGSRDRSTGRVCMEGSLGSLLSADAWTSGQRRAMPAGTVVRRIAGDATICGRLPDGPRSGRRTSSSRGRFGRSSAGSGRTSVTDRATLDCAIPRLLCIVAHFRPPEALASSSSFAPRWC